MLHSMIQGKLPIAALLALLALLLPAGAAAAQSVAPPLDRAIDDYAGTHEFSGTILVARHGHVLYRKSHGLAERAFSVPATDDTRYRIASITKLFTSVIVLQLAQTGRLDLQAPIRTYLPDYPGGGGDRVTLHQLLNHTSGLAQYDRITSLDQALVEGVEPYQRPQSAAQLLVRCCSGPLAREPGTAFDYNNADYILLGRIIERVTGIPYAEVLRIRLLSPLGLESSGMADQARIVPRLAPTYYWREDQRILMNDLPFYFQNWDAAGGMYSTVDDLHAFAEALYGGQLLLPGSLELLLTPGLDDYGYGLWSYDFERGGRRHRVAKRPGSIMGSNGVLYRLLDEQATVVILANTNRTDLDAFAQRIAEWMLDRETE
jgi:D-alanyl-D-alanine carboxypeptidase